MDLKTILTWKINDAFASTLALVDCCRDDQLTWKPSETNNWMTLGQLLSHLGCSCGTGIKGFISGEWDFPVPSGDDPPEETLMPAEKMPSVASIAEARAMLTADQALAHQMLATVSQQDLLTIETSAPWFPDQKRSLGYYVLSMIDHLNSHKTQLFSYLKILGEPVNTGHLWRPGA